MVDNKLSYVSHINHVKSKLTKGNAILAKVRHFVPPNLLKNTYHAHFQPHIDYGLTVWGHAAKTNLEVVNRQQRKAIRIMNFKKSDFKETDQLFKDNKILPLKSCLNLNSSKSFGGLETHFSTHLLNLCLIKEKMVPFTYLTDELI